MKNTWKLAAAAVLSALVLTGCPAKTKTAAKTGDKTAKTDAKTGDKTAAKTEAKTKTG